MKKQIQRLWTSRPPSETKFLLLIPVVGVATGVSAVALAHFIAFFQRIFWGSGQRHLEAATGVRPWMRVLILTLGGLAVGLIGRLFRVETRGAGTAGMIQALALKSGLISLRQTIPRVFAGVVTLASGGSLGREGPTTQLGGALGSSLGRRFHLSTPHLRILLCSAAGAAIAAVYNAPIGGTLFAMEVLIGNFALDVFGPVVVASVISTHIYRSAMGALPRFVVPQYQLVSGWELFAYLGLGILGGLVSVIFVKALFGVEDFFERMRLPKWLKPAVGFAGVGVIGCWYPHVFGNGYDTVNMVLHEDAQLTMSLLLLLPALKLAATALTLGAGGAGGLFMPSLMIGALLGGAFGLGVHQWWPAATADYGAYALVGMGAIVAGTTHAPITAIMMIFEQTNNYQIILPLMFVCIVSNATVRLLRVESVNLETLRRRGIRLPRGPEDSVMQNLQVADITHDDAAAIVNTAPFSAVVERFLKEPHNNLYVVDGTNRFLGAIRLHALKEMLQQTESLAGVIAHDLVDDRFECVTPQQKLSDAIESFWREHCERLPVVDNRESRKLIGAISKRDLMGVYNQEILQKRHLLGRFSYTDQTGRRDEYVELPRGYGLRTELLPSNLAGRTIAETDLRSRVGVHILLIKRRDPQTGADTIAVPEPRFRLEAEDRLVLLGTEESLSKFEQIARQG